jgi:cyclopropane fatty-acyl-phospholipid synthase-like methyltransferase
MSAGTASSADAERFERAYRKDPDPWGYVESAYEREKRDRLLASVGSEPIGSALEIGCSNGVSTASLATRCERVMAIDFSPEAVRLAADRTAGLEGIEVLLRDARAGLPTGPFDLIVCSEVLYYWTREEVSAFCDSAEAALAAGGSLVAVHWRGDDRDAPLSGDAVHLLLADRLQGWTLADSRWSDDYVLQRWRKPA